MPPDPAFGAPQVVAGGAGPDHVAAAGAQYARVDHEYVARGAPPYQLRVVFISSRLFVPLADSPACVSYEK